jgi:integrase
MLPHEPRTSNVLTLREQQAIFSRLPASIAYVTLFAVNTGLRRSEVLSLSWEWRVQGHPAFIIPGSHHKNKRDRIVVCNSIAASVLDAQKDVNPVHVFTHNDRPVSWTVLKYHWTRARKAAGLSNVRFHDLRHTFGSRLRAAGVSFEDRQDLLGHKSQQMTTHYSAPDISRLLEAAEKVVGMETETALRLVKSDKSPTMTFQSKEGTA